MTDDVRMIHADILSAAIEAAERREDGHIDEASLIAEVEKRLVFDVNKARKSLAKGIVKRAQQPGATVPVGVLQPTFPGFGHIAPKDYYPNQLVADADGNLIEIDAAPLDTGKAKLERAKVNHDRVVDDYKLQEATQAAWERWGVQQSRAGRAKRELTYGTFVRETGIWRPAASSGKAA